MLQEKEVMRIGGHKVIPINVRILCATNQDLYSLVESGRFREDLYYRLDVLSLHLPPLRERPADIDLLAKHFIAQFTDRRSITTKSLSGCPPAPVTAEMARQRPGIVKCFWNVWFYCLLAPLSTIAH